MNDQNLDATATDLSLVTFFRCHPYWFIRVQYAEAEPDGPNDKISLSTKLWEAICFYFTGRVPVNGTKAKEDGTEEIVFDPLWDRVLVDRQLIREFYALKELGFFNQKAP